MSPAPAPRIRRVGSVDSALSVLARAAAEDAGLPDFFTVLADHQTAGRGRSGREWLDSADASLLVAILVRVPECRLSWATLVAGIATCEALEARGLEPRLKWPNDVLLEGRKVGGILAEHLGSDPTNGVHALGIGIGLNLGAVPLSAGPLAGALPLHEDEAAADARESILASLHASLRALLASDPAEWHAAYTARLLGLGAPTTLRRPGRDPEPITPLEVLPDGALLALDARGRREVITVGDVDLPASARSSTSDTVNSGPASSHPAPAPTAGGLA